MKSYYFLNFRFEYFFKDSNVIPPPGDNLFDDDGELNDATNEVNHIDLPSNRIEIIFHSFFQGRRKCA